MQFTEVAAALETLPVGKSLTYSRDLLKNSVDPADKVIYMTLVRKLGDRMKCEVHVLEDEIRFVKRA